VADRQRLSFAGVSAYLAARAQQARPGQAYKHVEDLRVLTSRPVGTLPEGTPCLLAELRDIALAVEGKDLLEEVRRRAMGPCMEDDVALVASLKALGQLPKLSRTAKGDYLCREYLEPK